MNDTQDPDVAAAIREELILRVEATPVSRRTRRRATAEPAPNAARQVRPRPRRSGLIATGVTLAIVLVASAAAITLTGRSVGPSPATTPSDSPAPIEVDGKSIPFAGFVTWSDAVSEQPDRRILTISASGSVLDAPSWLCKLSQWRVSTVEAAATVSIQVRGYASPLASNEACAANAPQPHTIEIALDAPLGNRTLVDASTQQQQPVLDAGDVPILAVLPSVDTQSVTWDQATGIATRTYTDPGHPTGSLAVLQTGTPAALAASGAVSGPPDASDISINGSPASLWSYESPDGDGRTWQIEWTDKDGRRMRIVTKQATAGQANGTGDGTRLVFTKEEVILLARFVKSATPYTAPDTITHSATPNG